MRIQRIEILVGRHQVLRTHKDWVKTKRWREAESETEEKRNKEWKGNRVRKPM